MSPRNRALRVAVCIAGASVLALASAQSASAEWSPAFQVSGVNVGETPVGDGFTLNTGAANNGETVFVWKISDTFGDPAVYARRLHTDGTLSSPVELSAENSDVAFAETGLDGTTAFARGPFGGGGHTGRLLSPGDELGPITDLWASPDAFSLGTVVSSNGTAGFIGAESSETQFHHRYRRMTSGGLGPLQTLSTLPVGFDVGEAAVLAGSRAAIGADDTTAVAWSYDEIANEADQTSVEWRAAKIAPNGSIGTVDEIRSTGLEHFNTSHAFDVAVGAEGDAQVTWIETTYTAPAHTSLHSATVGPGDAVNDVATQNHPSDDFFIAIERPQIEVRPDGSAQIFWYRADGPDSAFETRTVAANGSLGPVQELLAELPALDTAVDGNGVVTLVMLDKTSDEPRLVARRIDPAGVVGPPHELDAGAFVSDPKVDADEEGFTTASWLDLSAGPTFDINVFASRFEPVDVRAPETTITSGPPKKTKRRSATFEFSADDTATFQCQLDAEGFESCESPFVLDGLKRTKYTFSVYATDEAGNADASPATQKWTVKKKKKKKKTSR